MANRACTHWVNGMAFGGIVAIFAHWWWNLPSSWPNDLLLFDAAFAVAICASLVFAVFLHQVTSRMVLWLSVPLFATLIIGAASSLWLVNFNPENTMVATILGCAAVINLAVVAGQLGKTKADTQKKT